MHTPIGVILTGDVKTISNNLDYLETNTSVNVSAVENVPDLTDTEFDNLNYNPKLDCNNDYSAESLIMKDTVDDFDLDEKDTETNKKLIDFVLQSTKRDPSGCLVMPLTWNSKNCHLLGRNYNLSLNLLKSTYNKLKNDPEKLLMYDEVFQEQRKLGIVEKVEDVENFLSEHPEASFLAHMGVFRMSNESTKCRVVYLSNLSEKLPNKSLTVSHNQAILPGPCLNHKILTSFMLLRFDRFLLIFDLMWYNNVQKQDFRIVAYKSLRLSFGLRCSPAILMIALYKILVLDSHGDESVDFLAKSVYNTIYMDNGSYSSSNPSDLKWAYTKLTEIFGKYQFFLQQFHTNDRDTQDSIDSELNCESDFDNNVKLFGMMWNRAEDSLSPLKLDLDQNANTKRSILSTLNTVYDIFGLYCPVLLRAKLFVQRLQSNADITWDSILSVELCKEWSNICKQTNSTPLVSLPRFVGDRSGEYELIAFTDASRDACGAVVYIRDVTTSTVSFLCANSKLFGDNLKKKSIPCLELYAIALGAEFLLDARNSLCGDAIVVPVKVTKLMLFTDSMVCIHWLNAYVNSFDKLQKLSVFVKNKLRSIDELCVKCPVEFRHTAGRENPADCVTKHYSYRALSKTNYYKGPNFLSTGTNDLPSDLTVTVPNPQVREVDEVPEVSANTTEVQTATSDDPCCSSSAAGDLIPPIQVNNYSKLSHAVGVLSRVLLFVNKLKQRLKDKGSTNVKCYNADTNFKTIAVKMIISCEQRVNFPEIYEYLESRHVKTDLPPLMSRLNLYLDSDSILRVKSKFSKEPGPQNPILLPKSKSLTSLIILEAHEKLGHAGLYQVLRRLRGEFYIIHYFSQVRKVLKECVVCRRLNARAVKLNQNSYRSFRSSPRELAFSDVYLDYIGPYTIKLADVNKKVWLLLITCTWSRAINLKICLSANVEDFLRAVQLHIHEYGLFRFCVSDLGSQITAGTNIIKTFLGDQDARDFFDEHNIESVEFHKYPKGNSSLGALVETCVKQVKHLIQKSIRTLILDYFDFEFLISKAISLINKRPISFKESLRLLEPGDVPCAITPEMVIKGYETPGLNVIPGLQLCIDDDDDSDDYSSSPGIVKSRYAKLNKAKNNLLECYHRDFLNTLIVQATDKPERYKPVSHKSISVGDVVLLVEKNTKRYQYPMARVISVESNELGEVTAARLIKGSTRETVYRHVTSLIPLLSVPEGMDVAAEVAADGSAELDRRPQRRAGEQARERIKNLSHNHLI